MIFSFFTAPEEQNTVQIINVAFSRDGRGSLCPDDATLDAVIKILWFHIKFKFMSNS